jgi:hypothetical protein
MPRPGTDVLILDDATPSGPNLNTGQAFFVGTAERGPTDHAVAIASPRRYAQMFGARMGGASLADGVNAFFQEGGAVAYVARVAGANAVAANGDFGSLSADASSGGAWGNRLDVSSVATSGLAGAGVGVTVALDDVVQERSGALADADALVEWARTRSNLVRFTKGADNVMPVAGTTVALADGVDDNALSDTTVGAALDTFGFELGPGQVLAPGITDPAVHAALLAHVQANMRCALLDLPDSDDPTVLAASVQALADVEGVRFAAAFAPRVLYPSSDAAPATVAVPYSGVQAGMLARVDALGNQNQPAAGINGVSRLGLGLSQTYSDDDREALNEAGVTLGKLVYGDVRTYGARTAAGPDDARWLWFGNSRVVMAIGHRADAIAQNYVLRQIDGRRQLFAALESELRGMLLEFFNAGALYGATPPEAFDVDTGSTVNTIETIAAGEVHAVIRIKTSPTAEWVQISIVKVPLEVPIAA